MTLDFKRPTHEGYDVVVPAEEIAPGVYTAAPNLGLAGNWRLVITATGNAAQDVAFRVDHSLVVPK